MGSIGLSTGNQQPVLQFGPFLLDLANAELSKQGQRIPLGPQAFKALAFLATHSGGLVTREDLCREIWGSDTFVDFEQGLNFCVWTLRAALEDDAKRPHYIETVMRRGYRFLSTVKLLQENARPAVAPEQGIGTAISTGFHRERRYRLSVCSFRDLTGRAVGEDLAMALREVLLTELVSDQSFVLVQPSRERTADAVLEGALVNSAGRIQLTARMADLRSGEYIWGGRRDICASDQSPRLDRIASSLVAELREKVQTAAFPRPKLTLRPHILEAYLQAQSLTNRRTTQALRRAFRCFEYVEQEAPEFVPALSGQAMVGAVLAGMSSGGRSEWEDRVLASGSRALKLDPTQADAHAALGLMESVYRLKWTEAQKALETAIDLEANRPTSHQWLSMVLAAQGRGTEALQEIRLAHWLDPDAPIIAANHALFLYLAGEFENAIEVCRQGCVRNPTFPWLRMQLGLLLEKRLKPLESIAEMEKAVRFSKGQPNMLAGLCRAYSRTGNSGRARRILCGLKTKTSGRPTSAYGVAACYSAMGEREEALEWLGKACEGKEPTSAMLPVDPLFDSLWGDRRFKALARQFGFSFGLPKSSNPLARIA